MSLQCLQIVEASFAGVGRHVIDLSIGLEERGHQVTLLYSPLRIDGRFELGLKALTELGATLMPFEMNREVGSDDIRAIQYVKRLVQDKKFDIVHGHSSKGGAIARMAGFGSGARVLYTPNAYITMSPDLTGPKARIFGFLEKSLAGRSHATINVSENERRYAEHELGIPAGNLHVIYNAIAGPKPGNRTELRDRFSLTEEDVVIGFVGRFSSQKNPRLAVAAFAPVARKNSRARLLMIGEGELGSAAQADAKAAGIDSQIIWAGAQDGALLMNAFDVFLLSSDYEGFPYVLLEAGAAGLPIVSTDMGAANEFVVEGKTGYLVPPRDADALSERLHQLVADASLRRSFGAASYERSLEFPLRRMIDQTETLYHQLIAAKS